MAHEIRVPNFGESIRESTVAQWLKRDGEQVTKGEAIVTLDTEKASTDLQAEVSGVLRIQVSAGTDVPIGAVIGTIEEMAPGAVDVSAVKPAEASAPETPVPVAATTPEVTAPPQASPAEVEPPVTSTEASSLVSKPAEGRETREPMSRLRRTLARRMLEARNETAMLTSFAEVDMSEVKDIRQRFGDGFMERHGIKLGLMSFFVRAAVDALKAFPVLNSSLEGNDIVHHHCVDMGVAVSTDRGLLTPVLRNADQLSFAEIEKQIADLSQRARGGKISLDELQGGTFTITNGGVFGSLMSTPLLNPPQVGILGMHSIVDRPVAIDGRIEIRPMMYLALSYDHRIVDGRDAVLFLRHVRDCVASPSRMLIGL